jgi:hypothetical protein
LKQRNPAIFTDVLEIRFFPNHALEILIPLVWPNPMHPTDGAHAHTPYILANKLRYKQKSKIKI